MNINHSLILSNLGFPLLVGKPVKDENGKITDFEIIYTNKEISNALDFVLKGRLKWSDLKADVTSGIVWDRLAMDAIAGRFYSETKYYSPASKKWYKIDIKYLAEEEYIIISFTDITSEHLYYQKLTTCLITDALTGLPNRAGFNDCFTTILEDAKLKNNCLGLLLIDIDNLQSVNDSRGTREGDSLILQVSEVLKRFQKENVQVFRFGDDEFAVIISAFQNENTLVNFIDCIYEAFVIKQIGVSGGVSFFPNHSEQPEELIRFADMAVHYAKKNGKNNFVYFEPDMQRVFIQHLKLQTKMSDAIADSSFTQFYQPQFDIASGQLRGFEALIRWTDPELGEIAPSVFIPLAEETGLIIPIGRWVLNQALNTLKTWQNRHNFKGIMSVNVSPVQLKQENFIPELFELIERYQIDPGLLEIEITEGVMINNMTDTIEKLQMLRDRGLRVSLDDFGTGYSSLSYLQMLPLNTLKIDKSFINDIASTDGVQANITSSIIQMVEKMGLETIAEGVEHPDQLEALNRFNCKIVQGFLRGKPMPFKLCDDYLSGDVSALICNGQDKN